MFYSSSLNTHIQTDAQMPMTPYAHFLLVPIYIPTHKVVQT